MLHTKSGRAGRLAVATALVSFAVAREARALTSSITKGSLTIKLTTTATINTGTDGTPQDLVTAPGDSTRMFVATRNGIIRTLSSGGTLGSTPFLNVGSVLGDLYTGGEGGMLGMAFSPNFATDGKFYTFQTETFSTGGPAADYSVPEMFPTTSTNPNNQTTIREWTINSSNPNVANTTSRVLLRLNHPESNHQGGALRFGPDGNLYITLGDGGGGNDFNGSVSSTTDGHNNTIGNGQDTTVPWGKILRINPNPAAGAGFTVSTNGQYSIPNSNPFISGAGGSLKEIYAYGLRNPFRINFDFSTGTLYAADVGQSNREEVDTISNGGNYGWPFREGTRDNQGAAGSQRTDPAGFSSVAPIAEYTHTDGEAIIGGELFRGSGFSNLVGKYVFGDLGSKASGSTIGLMLYTDPAVGTVSAFHLDSAGVQPSSNLYAVSAGLNGDLYALFSNGSVLKIGAGLFSNQWNISTGGSWATATNWSDGLPNLQPARANFLSALTAAGSVTLDGSRTVGQIVFNNANSYTIAQGSGGTLTIDDSGDPTGGSASITVTAGSHTISAPVSLASGVTVSAASSTSLDISGSVTGAGGLTKSGSGALTLDGVDNFGNTTVSAGTLTLAATGSLASATVTVSSGATFNLNGSLAGTATLNANGSVVIAGNTTSTTVNRPLAALNVGSNATTTVNPSTFPFTPVVLQPTALTFGATPSKLNLTNNELITTNTLAAVQGFLSSGKIFTTATGGALGYNDLGGGQVEIRFTLLGDTNLDGKVDVSDLGNLASSYGATTGAIWVNGDTDGNGAVDVTDLGNLASNYGGQLAAGSAMGGAVPTIERAASSAAVPEPSAMTIVLAPALWSLRRRKR